MFHKIVAAYNESPEAERALVSAIKLTKILNGDLHAVTLREELPSYTAFAGAADPSLSYALKQDREHLYERLHEKARALALSHDIELSGHLLDGHGTDAIVDFLRGQKADLLVIGLHQRDLYIARLWSTVYELAQDAPCSVLGVH